MTRSSEILRARARWAATTVLSMLWIGAAQAGPYTDLVVFGDSLSDTGNVLSLTTVAAPPPFPAFPGAEGRFSNGPIWIDALATGLGIPTAAVPANLLFTGAAVVPIGPTGGTNFAFGGARTGLGGAVGATTGLLGELTNWNGGAIGGSLTRAADPNAIYVISAGMNDMRDARGANPGNTAADDAARMAAANTAALNVVNVVALLAQAGARHFLVPNLFDLGKTPEASLLGVVSASTDASDKFNLALSFALSAFDAAFLGSTGIDLDTNLLDVHGLFEDMFANPAAYGITNLVTPCISPVAPGAYFFPGSVPVNCGASAFSDPLHPSARSHRLIADLAIDTLSPVAIPETGTLALLSLGIAGLAATRRRKQ